MRFSSQGFILASTALGFIAGSAALAVSPARPYPPSLARRQEDAGDKIAPQGTERLRKCESPSSFSNSVYRSMEVHQETKPRQAENPDLSTKIKTKSTGTKSILAKASSPSPKQPIKAKTESGDQRIQSRAPDSWWTTSSNFRSSPTPSTPQIKAAT